MLNEVIETANGENVIISKFRYERLLKYEEKLDALEAAGVDNWSGYDYAMEILRGEHDA